MRPPAQHAKHSLGVADVEGFAQHHVVDDNRRVRADDERIVFGGRDELCLFSRESLGVLLRQLSDYQ